MSVCVFSGPAHGLDRWLNGRLAMLIKATPAEPRTEPCHGSEDRAGPRKQAVQLNKCKKASGGEPTERGLRYDRNAQAYLR